jgi:hypothetical protein
MKRIASFLYITRHRILARMGEITPALSIKTTQM